MPNPTNKNKRSEEVMVDGEKIVVGHVLNNLGEYTPITVPQFHTLIKELDVKIKLEDIYQCKMTLDTLFIKIFDAGVECGRRMEKFERL